MTKPSTHGERLEALQAYLEVSQCLERASKERLELSRQIGHWNVTQADTMAFLAKIIGDKGAIEHNGKCYFVDKGVLAMRELIPTSVQPRLTDVDALRSAPATVVLADEVDNFPDPPVDVTIGNIWGTPAQEQPGTLNAPCHSRPVPPWEVKPLPNTEEDLVYPFCAVCGHTFYGRPVVPRSEAAHDGCDHC